MGRRAVVLAVGVVALLAVGVLAWQGRGGSIGDNGQEMTTTGERATWAGKEAAPEFPGGLTWFNVREPLELGDLRGKMVVLDFWTLGCINCQHIVPDLERLEAEFGDALVVIGVHSGKYSAEHEDEGIREAIGRLGLKHAVVNDPDFVFWDLYGASAWPTLVLIDPEGRRVGSHAGEGVYGLFQPILSAMLAEFEGQGKIERRQIGLSVDSVVASTVLSYPSAVVADEARGRLYIADAGHNRVLVATLDGRLERAIGSGKAGFADGAAGEAMFRDPQGLALSADGGTLYVADTRNHAIRAVDVETGAVKTIGGNGKQAERLPRGGSRATETAMSSPWGLLVRGEYLYIAMAGIHQIWAQHLPTGQVWMFAGTSREGIQDGDRLRMATLAQPSGLAADERYLYWVDPESSSVRRVAFGGETEGLESALFGEVETLVGTGLFDYGDEDGPRGKGKLQHPQGLAMVSGVLYVGDTYNHKVRTVDAATWAVGTAAGRGSRGWEDGVGMVAAFDEPAGVAAAGGRLFVADQNNHLIRAMDLTSGRVTTLQLTNLTAVATGGSGRVQKVMLPEQRVTPGVGQLRVVVRAPGGHKLNSAAPSVLRLTSSNGAVLQVGAPEVRWASDEVLVDVAIGAEYGVGSATLTASGNLYYCREGEESLCFILQVEVTMPVTVEAGASGGEARLEVDVPVGG